MVRGGRSMHGSAAHGREWQLKLTADGEVPARGTSDNRLVHASPGLRRGLPAQAMLRDTLGKGAGHRFARLRRALAAS
jgi:hypothetical protein